MFRVGGGLAPWLSARGKGDGAGLPKGKNGGRGGGRQVKRHFRGRQSQGENQGGGGGQKQDGAARQVWERNKEGAA